MAARRPTEPKWACAALTARSRPPRRLVHTELFDEPWYPGEARITTVLTEQGAQTTLTATILYESQEARDAVLKSRMEQSVAASYDRLAQLLAKNGT